MSEMETPILNDHNKAEYPPMHTAEHILNQTMVRMFGCQRSNNAHIERKKSKINYELTAQPTAEQIESTAYLIGWLCDEYDLIPNSNHVKGHCDLMATACPGRNLYDILQTIRGKAIWYEQHYQGGD